MGLDMNLLKRKKGEKVDSDTWDDVVYWRKANQIHNWFVKNVQDGVDDCGYYKVTKEQIEDLVSLCEEVLEKTNLVDSKVAVGKTLKDGEWVTNYEDGKIVENPEVAEELLPTQCGFFFGSTDYDMYYIQDLEYTVKELKNVLEYTDFDNEYLVYTSSW